MREVQKHAKTWKKDQLLIWSSHITQWLLTRNEVCIYIHIYIYTPYRAPENASICYGMSWMLKTSQLHLSNRHVGICCLIPVDEKNHVFFLREVLYSQNMLLKSIKSICWLRCVKPQFPLFSVKTVKSIKIPISVQNKRPQNHPLLCC